MTTRALDLGHAMEAVRAGLSKACFSLTHFVATPHSGGCEDLSELLLCDIVTEILGS